jgi:uncharacterized protein DUF4349
METTIGYLQTLHEDLLDAGSREGRRGSRRLPQIRDRFSKGALIAGATAVVLFAAATVGWLVRDDVSPIRRAVGEAGATGAKGGAAGTRAGAHFSVDESAGNVLSIPGIAPLPGDVPSTTLPGEVSRVIRTAEIGLVIPPDAFDNRFADAVDVASANGGFVASSTSRERSGSITMRVPSARFAAALRALRDLGDVEVQSVRGRDVTASYVDLRARLRISKARREVLLGLMAEARSIEQTIRVQNALDDTQLRIEEVQGQLRLLDDRTSLATIALLLREEGVEPEAHVETPSIPNAFERAAAGFVGVIAGVVVGLGYVIPVVLLALAAWFVVMRIRKRRAA